MPEKLKKNILASHKALGPDDEHILYSDTKIECCKHVSEKTLVKQLFSSGDWARLIGDYVNSYDRKMMKSYSCVEMVMSDVIRFILAARHGDCMYADCDCVVKRVPDVGKGEILAPPNSVLANRHDIYAVRFGTGLGEPLKRALANEMNGHPTKSATTTINLLAGFNPKTMDKKCYRHPVK